MLRRILLVNTLLLSSLLLFQCDFNKIYPPDGDGVVYEEIDVNFTVTAGFDDFSSPGAALGIAIDENRDVALIIALKFQIPLYTKEFTPGEDSLNAIKEYQWSRTNSVTQSIADEYPYIEEVLTDTAGIRGMDDEMTGFLVENAENVSISKIYIATEGSIRLTRMDGPSNLIEGDMSFVEITGADSTAVIRENGEAVKINDIYFEWDTTDQP
jgi:hypothetical protein